MSHSTGVASRREPGSCISNDSTRPMSLGNCLGRSRWCAALSLSRSRLRAAWRASIARCLAHVASEMPPGPATFMVPQRALRVVAAKKLTQSL
eukprot:scaffold71426_cov75-Phaeocystis_antarctica.AAC.1